MNIIVPVVQSPRRFTSVFGKQCLVPVAALLLLLTAGCAFRQSETTRAASFAPYTGRRIGPDDVDTFLQSRVAVLIASDHDPAKQWRVENTHLEIPAGGISGVGCAAAVDGRGYYLTAAHCVGKEFVYLVIYDFYSRQAWAKRARVVWQGNRRKDEPDLAILHVEHHLDHVFALANAVHKDAPVMAVGLGWTNNPDRNLRGLELMGGTLLNYHELKGEAGELSLANDVPLQPGDSGGPLLDTEGHLLGINVQGTPPFIHKLLPKSSLPTRADRPRPAWLRQTIEHDVAERHVEPTNR